MEWCCGPECPFFGEIRQIPPSYWRGEIVLAECQKHDDTEMGGYLWNDVGSKCLDTLADWEAEMPKLITAITARRKSEEVQE